MYYCANNFPTVFHKFEEERNRERERDRSQSWDYFTTCFSGKQRREIYSPNGEQTRQNTRRLDCYSLTTCHPPLAHLFSHFTLMCLPLDERGTQNCADFNLNFMHYFDRKIKNLINYVICFASLTDRQKRRSSSVINLFARS